MSAVIHHDLADQIRRLKAAARELPQAELKTDHYFADGLYCRALWRPADTLIFGKCHRREHLYLVISGDVTIFRDGTRLRVKAPHIFVSAPGTERAVYSHEDSLCVTVHRTDERDLDRIEADLIEPDETALFDAHNHLKLLTKT